MKHTVTLRNGDQVPALGLEPGISVKTGQKESRNLKV